VVCSGKGVGKKGGLTGWCITVLDKSFFGEIGNGEYVFSGGGFAIVLTYSSISETCFLSFCSSCSLLEFS